MSTRADASRKTAPDSKRQAPGAGHYSAWYCMGCHQSRSGLGRRGVGVKARCAVCLSAKGAA